MPTISRLSRRSTDADIPRSRTAGLSSLRRDQDGAGTCPTTRMIVTDSGPSGILKGMEGNGKEPWVPHGNVKRFIKKGVHGMQKANGRELRAGSLPAVKRDMRSRLQAEHPEASPAEIEAIIERRCGRGMKAYRPATIWHKQRPRKISSARKTWPGNSVRRVDPVGQGDDNPHR